MKESDLLEINISQKPAIKLLESMGYIYIEPKKTREMRSSGYDVLLKDILRQKLKEINRYEYANETKEFSNANIERAIEDIDEPIIDGLLKSSERILNSLMLGKSYMESVGDGKNLSFNLNYIDWKNFENNVFHVTEEYSVDSSNMDKNCRPDIVLFINGIPFSVIECKSSVVDVKQGISQMIRNQKEEYIPQLFKFSQILMATNKNEVYYATTKTPSKFWSVWKEEDEKFLQNALEKHVIGRTPTNQDKNIISMFSKERVYDLMRYFVFYDANIKKICRYQQYFAIKETIKSIQNTDVHGNRQSGVIWHTQGSGKSLTMVMLAKYILMEMSSLNPKVIVVTDRKELDSQIAKTFLNTSLKPARAKSGRHLEELIRLGKADIVTSIINKFSTAEKLDVKNDSKNIFVLVDESHRSNYGGLATKMRIVFENACYIGFTGTPLMKQEKNTMTKFGNLIHKYTIKDGVDDGAIVPLIYEGKFVDQNVDEANIDLWFEQTTKKLTDAQKKDLKSKWSNMKRLASTNARIQRVALDINLHFIEGYLNTGFKAMFATNSKKDAVRYFKTLEMWGDLRCAVLISSPDLRESEDDVDDETDNQIISFWKKMMDEFGDADKYEETIKNRFQDGEIDILIVCSKLLTGFDAPICQVLYIDKELKEHGLLQAIARTNRLAEGKDYGLVVDYRGLIKKLNDAMDMYTGAGLDAFDEGDLKGTIVDIMSAIGELKSVYSTLVAMFNKLPQGDEEAIETYLADDELRQRFYSDLSLVGRKLSIVLNSETAYTAFDKDELDMIKSSFTMYSKIRRSVKIRYRDMLDNAEYEPLMQNLLDQHLSVVGLNQITSPINILDKEAFEKELEELTSLKARADAIANGLAKSISEKRDENPAYYDKFSKKIRDSLEEYKNKVITEAEYLSKLKEILNDFALGKVDLKYPEEIKNNPHAQAFYGVVSSLLNDEIRVVENQDLIVYISLKITEIIEIESKVDWSQNLTVHKKIAQDIDDLFYEIEKEKGVKIPFDTIDKVIESVKTVALRRYHVKGN